MKKSVALIIAVVALAAAYAQNEDLVPATGIDNYYSGSITWDALTDSASTYSYNFTMVGGSGAAYVLDSFADGATIYGIAVCVTHLNIPMHNVVILDTAKDTWCEYTQLYKPIGDSMVLLGEAPFNQFSTPTYVLPPIRVYANPNPKIWFDKKYVYGPDSSRVTPPLFETYFDTGYYVTDSFYIGTTADYLTENMAIENTWWYNLIMLYSEYCNTRFPIERVKFKWYDRFSQNPRDRGWHTISMAKCAHDYIIFPILTPDPDRSTPTPVDTVLSYFDTTSIDTTGQGIDTTGVDTTGAAIYSPQLLERYTQLIPSVVEAGGTATVLSSFHLQAVELYDAAGRLVQSRPARGTAAAVDCTALPRGSYLVRLVTTAGTTTKKLTIR
ncbi:MAG: T9SS type A sorting domain-containing protein [Bacteroidales bacterium]|nr:T9SS type A sorting domain-containing protein [Bacteroidales bacterium]